MISLFLCLWYYFGRFATLEVNILLKRQFRWVAALLLILQMMKLRLQQPSGTELAPFNPILPPASITQVMLLANPLKVRLNLELIWT